MIEVRELTKNYGDKRGVENVSFTIEKGEIVGLLGPNGAGKSTIMKMMTGYLMPTSGTVRINGFDTVESPKEASASVGFMPEIPPLYVDMEAEEYLEFIAEIRGVKKAERKAHIAEVMELASVTHVKNRLIRNLSKGYRQRVGLAQALIGYPEILILDEPTVGLDPKQIAEVRDLLLKLKERHTIILSSHILSEINQVCEKIIIINRGHVVTQDTTENLEAGGVNADKFRLKVRGESDKVLACVKSAEGVQNAELIKDDQSGSDICCVMVTGEGDDVRAAVFFALAAASMPMLELTSARQTLEQVFLSLTSDGTKEA